MPREAAQPLDLFGNESNESNEILGIDCPMPNGCWRCIGCGKLLRRDQDWNQCSDCDTRDPEDY